MNKKIFIILFLSLLFVCFSYSCSFAAEPRLISRLNSAFESIEGWILTISTPAAAVAVGTGVLIKKFSFGDDERIRVGKKLIRSSLFSYAFILAIDLILSTIKILLVRL